MWLKYSHEKIEFAPKENRQWEPRSEFDKPMGFWITDESEDNWESWCRSEEFSMNRLSHIHECVLDEGNILFLKSKEDLYSFTDQYGTTDCLLNKELSDNLRKYREQYRVTAIDWRRVADNHTGIIITPYVRECRLTFDQLQWYYTWDCASGCIWDETIIKEVNLLRVNEDLKEWKSTWE